MKSTFQRNLAIGFGFSLFLLIISAVASYISIGNLVSSAESVEHTNQMLHYLDDAISYMKDAETGQRGYLITGDESFLEPYRGAEDSIRKNIRAFRNQSTDNPVQQAAAEELFKVSNLRMAVLNDNIVKKRRGQALTTEDMNRGKVHMAESRRLIDEMKDRERLLLTQRTEKMNRFASSTPVFIVIASIIAVLITLVSYLRVSKDFKERLLMQKSLEDKDADISRRINIIRNVAGKISSGDYSTRVEEGGEDGLGVLSVSLNRMASSLETSFNELSEREWMQAGIATLNDKMIGEYELPMLSRNVIDFLVQYTGSQTGAFYVAEGSSHLRFTGGFAIEEIGIAQTTAFGEGLAGQCALSRHTLKLEDIPDDLLSIRHATGTLRPRAVIAVPLYHERKIAGVIELGSLRNFSPLEQRFLEEAAHNIGTAIYSVESRKRLQELLEETQSQAEELQAQHNELENINSELEAQTEKLQASEEELRVQQAELVEANDQLEDRARMLEETNQLVMKRNMEVQAKAEELAQSTRYKSEFLANMSHELRTPLNSILLLSRLLAENGKQNLNSEQIEYAQVIQQSGKGLLTLIDEILDLSKIEAGKMDLVYSEVGIDEMIQDMTALFTPVAMEKNIRFMAIKDKNVPVSLETDRQRLEQILRNLLSNALKFTNKGSVEMKISRPGKDGQLAFSVKDTGIGIAEDKQDLIFEAFRQEDGSTRRKYGGTGLGLSISRDFARLLGGDISLKSKPGKGSEFIVTIPESASARRDGQEIQEIVPEREKEIPPVRERFVSEVIPGQVDDDRNTIKPGDRVILIVEDDTSFARSLLEFTRSKGYKGVVTVRGDEAAPLAEQYMPLGVLLDIQLPVKDGWEVMEELKGNEKTRHIPVHVMSSYQARFKSLSKGAVDFIDKPLSFEKMEDIFSQIEFMLNHNPRKVLIVEENIKHAKALAYFLGNYKVNAEIKESIRDSVEALLKKEVNCVILDMGASRDRSYDTLEEVKKQQGLENIPIIVFTGRNLSRDEELQLRGYADSVVIKVASSYQRIMDEVSLFLHLVAGQKETNGNSNGLGTMDVVLRGKTVLVADDDVRNIFSLSKALEACGMKVVSAMDGREALGKLKQHPADIVLMDMMMPVMDGYESTRLIKADPKTAAVPVIAVTAKAMKGDREKCIEAGASDYISKPVDIDQLLSLLRVWLYDTGK
ncbi:response regulator [Chitinophaga sp. GCM10012297]|uniref:histidine kinase n=1 Tax=Chitinophaga chungangae TaxID=2821488 RepID=A0ABS3YDH5_9BACT|nr:response regulator [Chitinophaga chungangae]MBO9152363.1 response regulator [Chitinophaga chungangae]